MLCHGFNARVGRLLLLKRMPRASDEQRFHLNGTDLGAFQCQAEKLLHSTRVHEQVAHDLLQETLIRVHQRLGHIDVQRIASWGENASDFPPRPVKLEIYGLGRLF